MMPDRLYSIIVPVYNAEATLHRCVDSILAQTYHNFELILVDDGSRDSSADIIDQYASADTRVIAIHKFNGGVSSARNAGLDRATGDYVAFIDADDYVDSDYLDGFQSRNEDLIIGGFLMFGDSDFSQNLPTSYIKEDNEKIDLIEKHFGSLLLRAPWAKVFKKSVFDQNSLYFNQNIRLGEDTILVLNYIYYCESISLIPYIHYLYYFQKNKMESYKLTARDYYNSISLIEHSMMQLAPKKRIPGSLYIIRTIFKDAFYQALWNNGMDFAKENSLTYIKLRMWQFFPITSIVIRLRKSLVMLLWPIVYHNMIIKNSYEKSIR